MHHALIFHKRCLGRIFIRILSSGYHTIHQCQIKNKQINIYISCVIIFKQFEEKNIKKYFMKWHGPSSPSPSKRASARGLAGCFYLNILKKETSGKRGNRLVYRKICSCGLGGGERKKERRKLVKGLHILLCPFVLLILQRKIWGCKVRPTGFFILPFKSFIWITVYIYLTKVRQRAGFQGRIQIFLEVFNSDAPSSSLPPPPSISSSTTPPASFPTHTYTCTYTSPPWLLCLLKSFDPNTI